MPAYNSSNGNELPFIYQYPGAPYPSLAEWEAAQSGGRVGLLKRMFSMAKLEVSLGSKGAGQPPVSVQVDATPEEMAVATMVGKGLMGKAKEKLGRFLRLGR
tara:strand:+ start:995 stop:1300 length:306 start_codon:yes stop_codon:yes gene_type:complete